MIGILIYIIGNLKGKKIINIINALKIKYNKEIIWVLDLYEGICLKY